MTRLRNRPGLFLVVLGSACLLLAGCTAVTTLINTDQALRDAGYQSVSVGFHVGSGDEIDVSVKVSADATEGDARDVAHVVWNHFHERFQRLHVTVNGTGGSRVSRLYAHQDLVTLFGPRNPAWDRTTVSSATTRLGAFVIGGLAVVALVVVVVVIVVTRRRRSGPGGGYPGTWHPGGGHPGSGYPGVGQPGGGYPGSQPGRWQPGVGWQPSPGAPAPDPLWPPPQGPPPGRPSPPGQPPPGGGSGWGSPPEQG